MNIKQLKSYSKEDLISCSKGDLFGSSNGKLPNNEMLMIDRINEINCDGGIYQSGLIKAN